MGRNDNPKVARPNGPNGGDTMEVRAGGTVKIFSLGSGGGALVPSGGTQAVHIADRTVATATGGASATALNASLVLLASGINETLAALRNIGVLATS